MGSMFSCFCPRSPESEPLLFNAKQFSRYEIVLHKPPPKDWMVVKNIIRDEFVVDKVNYYILKEWGVKPGHLLRQVQKDPVQAGVNPIRGMETKNYPLTIIFAKKRTIIRNDALEEEDSSDISREDSFVPLKGVALYDGPQNPTPIRNLNHRDLVTKTEELEAALNNLNRQFKKQRQRYVESSRKYKEADQEKQRRLQRDVEEQKRKAEKARTVAGGASSVSKRKPKITAKNIDTKADGKASGIFEGYLMKYGGQGSKKPKRKWVRFFLGKPKNQEEDSEGQNKVILQYSDDANHFQKSQDKVKECIVLKLMDAHEMKTNDPEKVKRTQFGVWVADEKEKEKGLVFGSENEDTRNAWVKFVEAIHDRMLTHGETENIFKPKHNR